MEYYTLNNGVKMPKIGYGTYKIPPDQTKACVINAINLGYRHIDTASFYQNEQQVGEAIRHTGIKREDIFVTTKLWTDVNSYDKAIQAVSSALAKLHTPYIDLVLIHWPIPQDKEVWCALEDVYNDGLVKAIGTSNFKRHHINEILEDARISPMVNQIELHPYFQQVIQQEYCKEHNIQLEAWSPLLRGGLDFDAKLMSLAFKYSKSVAQITLRFLLQEGISAIPKSTNIGRMAENINIFDFALSEEDMNTIRGLNKNIRYYRDPDKHGF